MLHPAFPDTNTGYGYLTWLNAFGTNTTGGGANNTCAPYAQWASNVTPAFPESAMTFNGGPSPYESPTYDVGVAWAAGLGGQFIIVHRGLDLVITARNIGTGSWAIWDALRPAVVALDPTYAGDMDGFCDAYRTGDYAPTLISPWFPSAPKNHGEVVRAAARDRSHDAHCGTHGSAVVVTARGTSDCTVPGGLQKAPAKGR
jgi:hypothetical protein